LAVDSTIYLRLEARVTNVDISPESIRFLKEGKREGGVAADAFYLPFKNGSFDGMVSLNLINTGAVMNRRDLEDIFCEMGRVIKEGGYLIQSHFGFYIKPLSQKDQLAVLESAGFQNIQLIENRFTKELANFEPLTFIAEKGEGAEGTNF